MKAKLKTAMITVTETVDVDVDIDLMDYVDELEDAGFVLAGRYSTISEFERLTELADEAARVLRYTPLALALRDSIDRCRRQMKIDA